MIEKELAAAVVQQAFQDLKHTSYVQRRDAEAFLCRHYGNSMWADLLEISPDEMRNMVKEYLAGTRVKKRPDANTLESLYLDKGLSTYEIGEMYGYGGQSVASWLRTLGIPTRKNTEAATAARAKTP